MKTRPRAVKKSTLSCVSQTMSLRTASSSRVTMQVMPLSPPLAVEPGLRLAVAHLPRLRHQLRLRIVRGRGSANCRNDLVEISKRDQVAEQDVLALARLLQLELGAAADHVAPVVDVGLEHL